MSEYTEEQHAEVRRVLRLGETAYYETLLVDKKASAAEIKRAYKRMALRMHPDKNKAPKSDEAFKRISKAFQVLGDEDKRRMYDQTGADPDSRRQSAGFNPAHASAFSSARRGAQPFAADDFAQAFFGGAGGPFMGTSFGPGVRFQFSGGGADDLFSQLFGGPRARPQRAQPTPEEQQRGAEERRRNMWVIGFVSLALLLGPTLIEWLVPSTPESGYAFMPRPGLDTQRVTPKYKIPYFVNGKHAEALSNSKLRTLDRRAENEYISDARLQCSREYQAQQRAMRDAQGFFRVDKERYERAKNTPLPHCDILDRLGLPTNPNFL